MSEFTKNTQKYEARVSGELKMAWHEAQITLTYPVSYSEIVDESTYRERQCFRECLVESKITDDTPLHKAVAAYRNLLERGFLSPELFVYRVAMWCGYVAPAERPQTDFDPTLFEAELRAAGVPEIADLWLSDPEAFECGVSRGRYIEDVQYAMRLN